MFSAHVLDPKEAKFACPSTACPGFRMTPLPDPVPPDCIPGTAVYVDVYFGQALLNRMVALTVRLTGYQGAHPPIPLVIRAFTAMQFAEWQAEGFSAMALDCIKRGKGLLRLPGEGVIRYVPTLARPHVELLKAMALQAEEALGEECTPTCVLAAVLHLQFARRIDLELDLLKRLIALDQVKRGRPKSGPRHSTPPISPRGNTDAA